MCKAETAGEVTDYLRLCFAIRKLFQDERGGGVESKYLSIVKIEDGGAIFRIGGANRIWDSVHVDGKMKDSGGHFDMVELLNANTIPEFSENELSQIKVMF